MFWISSSAWLSFDVRHTGEFRTYGNVAKDGTCRRDGDFEFSSAWFSREQPKKISDPDQPESRHGEAPQKYPNPISPSII